jgi:23S rRNA (adenine2503-C2)-methyltransferase
MSSTRLSLHDLPLEELRAQLAAWKCSPAHATTIWRGLYREGITRLSALSDLPARLRERLEQECRLERLTTKNESDSSDGLTRKYLLGLADGQQIETVLMRYPGRATACLSSQAGCALGCVFCATGQLGFARNLRPGEIVAQALHVQRALRDQGDTSERLRNLVLMGMGEPLLNYDAVMTALDILRDPGGLAIAGKRITISTVGVVPGIVRLAEEGRPYSLAVSLHAAEQDERAALIPAAKTWPLGELLDACRYYTTKLDRRIFFEWTLIAGVNDSPQQAHAVGQLLSNLPAHLNLIPLNRTEGYSGEPGTAGAVDQFQAILADYALPSTVRQRRGLDIAAGCGQLAATAG